MESAKLASASTSISRESFNGPLPFQQMLLGCQMNFFYNRILALFKLLFFCWVLGKSETAHKPFKRGISVSYSALGPLDISPFAFSKPDVLGAHLSGQIPGIGVL